MAAQPERLCYSITVPENFSTGAETVGAFLEKNVSPIAYFVCGEGWSHFIEVEVVDVV